MIEVLPKRVLKVRARVQAEWDRAHNLHERHLESARALSAAKSELRDLLDVFPWTVEAAKEFDRLRAIVNDETWRQR